MKGSPTEGQATLSIAEREMKVVLKNTLSHYNISDHMTPNHFFEILRERNVIKDNEPFLQKSLKNVLDYKNSVLDLGDHPVFKKTSK